MIDPSLEDEKVTTPNSNPYSRSKASNNSQLRARRKLVAQLLSEKKGILTYKQMQRLLKERFNISVCLITVSRDMDAVRKEGIIDTEVYANLDTDDILSRFDVLYGKLILILDDPLVDTDKRINAAKAASSVLKEKFSISEVLRTRGGVKETASISSKPSSPPIFSDSVVSMPENLNKPRINPLGDTPQYSETKDREEDDSVYKEEEKDE